MLNFRLLFTLLDTRRVHIFLGVIACLGFGTLVDIIVLLNLATLAGPWVIMAILAFLSALAVLLTYKVTEYRRKKLTDSIGIGEYDESLFTTYLTILIAGIFLIIPGIVNTIFGLLFLIRQISLPLVNMLIKSAGIDWSEAYEYLYLNGSMVRKEFSTTVSREDKRSEHTSE